MTAIWNSYRADLLRLRRWPAVWVTLAAWMLIGLLFGYVFNYATYRTGSDNISTQGQRLSDIYADLLPQALPNVLIQGLPMFGAALMAVLGAIVAGNGYGYGTWKTVYTQGPSRGSVTAGSLLALGSFVTWTLVATTALFAAVATVIALVEGEALVLPSLTDLAVAFGAGWLVLQMWALAGYALGTLARGPALSVGLGLVWMLVVEQLLRGVGGLLGPVEAVTDLLPGTAAGSLVGAIVAGDTAATDTPGVLDVLSGPAAATTLTVYLLLLVVAVFALVRGRDVA